MMPAPDYWRQWFSSDYLTNIWDSIQDNLLNFWNSDLRQELTKPQTLKLFGLSALLGVLVPITIMIVWRVVNARKNKKVDHKQYDENSLGSFNKKLLGNIKTKSQEKKEDDFDPISPKEGQPKGKKKNSKGDNRLGPTASSVNETKKEEKKCKKSGKNKETTEIDATRFNSPAFDADNFKLNDEDVDALSHMELHGKLKSATLKARANKLEESMSAEEREKEQKLKMEQLENIFKLMQNEGGSKFGIQNKEDLMEQFKIYS